MNKWLLPMPIWTGRPDADGYIAKMEIPMIWFLFIMTVAILNATIWGCLGLYFAVRVFA